MVQTDDMGEAAPTPGRPSLLALAQPFLKLGFLGFGGPAAHIGLMEQELVVRRGWLSHGELLDLMGAVNLIPGPNSTEMCIHIGYRQRGWRGMLVAGGCFILPAVLMTTLLAWAYVRFGALPRVEPFLFGAKPAVLAVIVAALWRLGRTAVKSAALLAIGLGVAAAAFLGANEVLALLGGGLLGMVGLRLAERGKAPQAGPLAAAAALGAGGEAWAAAGAAATAAGTAAAVSLWKLGLFFLKVGAVLYGTGYVLVAFIEGGLVRDYGWLTQRELLDAIAAGQLTPGPLLSTSAFVGYLVAGKAGLSPLGGAAAAAAGVFLPSFVLVVLLNPILPRLRRSRWSAAFLDAVNVSSVALMVAVAVSLGRSTLVSWPAWAIAALAGAAAVRWRLNTAWLVLGGAALGALLAPWAGA